MIFRNDSGISSNVNNNREKEREEQCTEYTHKKFERTK